MLAGTIAQAGFSTAEGERDMFCMRLGVFGVVVSVGDAIALFRLGVRYKGRLGVRFVLRCTVSFLQFLNLFPLFPTQIPLTLLLWKQDQFSVK